MNLALLEINDPLFFFIRGKLFGEMLHSTNGKVSILPKLDRIKLVALYV